jgi:tetratricopeptide (TPR) repeat protein
MKYHHRKPIILLLILVAVGALAWPRLLGRYHLRAARTALEQFHTAEAQSHLDVCLKTWPNRAEVRLLAGRCARQAEVFEEAQEHLATCQRLEGTASPESVLEAILIRAAMGDLDQMDEYLLARAEKEPALAARIWDALVKGYLRMYRMLDALACLERWLQYQPDNVQALFLRGNFYRQLNKLPKAAPDYRRAVELDPERDDARSWFTVCLLETARYDEAIPHLEYLHARRPDDSDVQVRLARCHARMGRVKQARELLDAVLAEHPDHGSALRTHGELAQLAGDLAEAEKWLRQAVKALPQDYQTNWSLSQVLQQQDKSAEAKAQLARVEELKKQLERLGEISSHAMASRPHDPALHCELGTLLISLGHRDLGERWLQSALHQDARYQPAHAALADYYESQGKAQVAAYHRQLSH